MKKNINIKPQVLQGIGNNMPKNTIFNHYELPMTFKKDCEDNIGTYSKAKKCLN